MYSQSRRTPSPLWPWLPIWVMTLYWRAASVNCRVAPIVCAIGFSTYTCLPNLIAIIAAVAWWWSGVATKTASIWPCIRSNIRR